MISKKLLLYFVVIAIAIATITIALISFLSQSVGDTKTEKAISYRCNEYIKACEALDYSLCYGYLTKNSKENIDFEEWKEHIFKTAQKSDDKIVKVVLDPSKIKARVDIEMKSKHGSTTNLYSQTWLLEDNAWYRAYAEDKKLQKKTSTSSSTAKESIEKPQIHFDLVDVEKDWYLSVSSLQKERLYQPQLKFKVRNTGSANIEYLRLMAIFYEEDKNEIYNKSEKYVVSTGDVALSPGYSSETIFLRTSIGYVYNEYNQAAIFRHKFRIKIYYKSNSSEDWRFFKDIDF